MGYEAAVNTALARLGKSRERTSDYLLALVSGIPQGLLAGLAARDHYKRQKAEEDMARLQYERGLTKDAADEDFRKKTLSNTLAESQRRLLETFAELAGRGSIQNLPEAYKSASETGQVPELTYQPAYSAEESAALAAQLGLTINGNLAAALASGGQDKAYEAAYRGLSSARSGYETKQSNAETARHNRAGEANAAASLAETRRHHGLIESHGGYKTLDDVTKAELENDRDYLEANRKITALQHQTSVLSARLNQGSGQYGAGASTAEQDRATLTSTAAELERARKFSDDLYYWYLGGKYGPRPSPYSKEPFVPSTPDAYAGGGVQTKVSPDGNVIYVTGSPRR